MPVYETWNILIIFKALNFFCYQNYQIMSHDPKLEIYKLTLVNKADGRLVRFRESFRENVKSIASLPKPIEDTSIYREFYKHFLDSIDNGKGYKKNDKKEKAYKIAKDEIEKGKPKSIVNSITDDNFIISGLLEGGKYGIKRNLGDIDNIDVNSDIKQNHVVGDRFFFLLFAPINQKVGILLIQGYTEIKLSDVFRDHIVEYFKVDKKIGCETELFIPESLKQKYLSNAIFKSAKFSSGFVLKNNFEDADDKNYDIEVKIEIIDKSAKKTGFRKWNNLLNKFGQATISLADKIDIKLESFQKKSAKMVGKGKEFPIDFSDEDNIKPVILLIDQGITIKEGRIPDFDQIETYCKNLLKDIISEINPENAVTDI